MRKHVTKPLQKISILNQIGMPLLTSESQWPIFSSYEIIGANGNYHIRASKNAKLDFYKPFQKFPEILKDFLNTGQTLESIEGSEADWKKKEEQKARQILPFISSYGSLGLMWNNVISYYSDYQKKPIKTFLHLRESLTGTVGAVPLDDYLDFFISKDYRSNLSIKRWDDCYSEAFLRGYSEPVGLLYGAFSELLILQKESYESLSVWPIGMTLRKQKVKVLYDFIFASLLMAIRIMLLRNEVEIKQPLKICPIKGCGYFIASRRNRVYCDNHQQDSILRVKRYRSKHKSSARLGKSKSTAAKAAKTKR